GPTPTAVDLDGGRIDDGVVDALRRQPAMQPEAVAAGLVTTHHGGILGQSETPLGPGDLGEQPREAPRHEGAQPRRLAMADGEGELPLAPPQLKSQVQTRTACGTLWFADRGHDELLGNED